MSILNIQIGQAGLVGVVPRVVYINTNDTLAAVTATGYLNESVQRGYSFSEADMALVTTKTSPSATTVSVAWLEVQYVAPNWSLTPTGSPGSVTLPTIANHIATYTNTLGTLSEDPATAISGGNIQAGLSGTAGAVISFPGTASKGSLKFAAVANTGNTVTTISNAAMAQATTVSLPDPGVATTKFILADNAGTQHIATGALSVDTGTITSGSSGAAGSLITFPATASSGKLALFAVNNSGDFTTTISNAAQGQATTYSIGDIGASTGGLVVATAALRMKAGAQVAVAGGNASQTVTDTFCTTTSTVIANWNDTTNAVEIKTVAAGNGSFVVVSTGDPGASHINYIITK